ncbi:hypothetical protein [Brachybacterium sacelli]|uniref:hypothetical protein n=1 Tax=Brachybacterium sacelli TaxID=173364 RepID=UPI00338B26A3
MRTSVLIEAWGVTPRGVMDAPRRAKSQRAWVSKPMHVHSLNGPFRDQGWARTLGGAPTSADAEAP